MAQGSIKGKLYDSVSKQYLSLATVTVFKAKDTSIVTYRLTNPAGEFKVPGLPLNILLRAVITSSGYKAVRKEFMLSTDSAGLDLGNLIAQLDTSQLEEVLVTAERPPVTYKKDTIEFNASAFKTLPTALVEDLLKKLPGVEIDQEGNIRVNGRAVNRIMVDGKDFFGGDPRVASKNLPANLIDKVQVVDDKQQKDRDPEIATQDLGQVINLKLKKSIKKGWFGKAYAGGGSGAQNHYETGAIINTFRDTVQLSILGYTNNINKSGFSLGDIESLGGFRRSGYNSVSIWNDGGVAINGISFGATGQGIQRSSGGGVNFSHDPSKKLKLSFQYFVGQINSDARSKSNTIQNIGDTIVSTFNLRNDNSTETNHNFGLSIKLTPDTLSYFEFSPTFLIRNRRTDRIFSSESRSNFDNELNESNNITAIKGSALTYAQDLSYNRRSRRKKGRSFNTFSTVGIGSGKNSQTNQVISTFFKGGLVLDTLNQFRDGRTDQLSVDINSNYYEPLSKKITLRLFANFSYRKENESIATLDWNPTANKYNIINTDLTNGLDRDYNKSTLGSSLVMTIKKFVITPSLSGLWLNFDNRFQKGGNLTQSYFYMLPSLSIRISQINFSFRQSVREPSALDLRPVPDNSNPLYQSFGNPDLEPAITNTISFNFYKNLPKRQLNYNINSFVNFEENVIIRERLVSPEGTQITKPINVDGIRRASLGLYLSKQYKIFNNWQLSFKPSVSTNYNGSVVIVNGNRSGFETYSLSPALSVGFNYKDLFEFSQRYSSNLTRTVYESTSFRDLEIITHNASTELIVRMPKNWVWESTLDYRYNPQVSSGIGKSFYRWNAGINFLFLKDQKGQLKLFVYDILKQNTNINRTVFENYVQDTESNTLTRYLMLTFTYNIRDFKGGKVGGRQNMFFF